LCTLQDRTAKTVPPTDQRRRPQWIETKKHKHGKVAEIREEKKKERKGKEKEKEKEKEGKGNKKYVKAV
jgi:hypothetical protein